jgi:hypothetical protein
MTVSRSLLRPGSGQAAPGGGGGPLPVSQTRFGYAAIGVAMVLALGAVGAWLYVQAGAKTPVVVVAADIPTGHVIRRADLSTVEVAGGITAVGGHNLDSVVGLTAAVHLLPGTVLHRAMVTSVRAPAAGEAAVGVAVKGGQIPADGVSPGDTVAVLHVPGRGGTGAETDADQAQVLVKSAEVFSFRPDPSQAGGSLVTVIVPQGQYLQVAAASSAGRIALVEVPSS